MTKKTEEVNLHTNSKDRLTLWELVCLCSSLGIQTMNYHADLERKNC